MLQEYNIIYNCTNIKTVFIVLKFPLKIKILNFLEFF